MCVCACVKNSFFVVGLKREKREYFKMNKSTKSTFKSTGVSSSLIGCPIHMPVCHICSLTKPTAGNVHVCNNEIGNSWKIANIFMDLFILKSVINPVNLELGTIPSENIEYQS